MTATAPAPTVPGHAWHRRTFTTITGESRCEDCARVEAGWRECLNWGCYNLTPPPTLYCDDCKQDRPQLATAVECPGCGGDGDVLCDEFDCHGTYCDGGIHQCTDCGGRGTVQP